MIEFTPRRPLQPLPGKQCRGCAFFATYDMSVISEALKKNGHTSETVDAYHKSFSGGDGRCMKKDCRTTVTDWCKFWEAKGDVYAGQYWPASVEEAMVMPTFNPPKLYDGPKKPKETK